MNKIFKLVVVLMLITSIAGCQKTPESPIVVGKDYGEMMNQAMLGQPTDDSIRDQVGATEKYVLDNPLENEADNLKVYVDAEVIIPDSSTMTTATVSRHSFSEEECKKIIEVLFNDQKTYAGETAISKPKLEKKIADVKKEIAETTEEKMLLILNETLKKYELELNSMGEEDGMVEKPVQFTVDKNNYNEEKMYLVSDGSDGIYRSIKISNNDEFRSYNLVYRASKNDYPDDFDIHNVSEELDIELGTEYYGNPDDIPQPVKSEEEAVSDANKMLLDLGIQDFVAKEVDVVFGEINGEIQKAYRISFMRSINGVSFNYSFMNESYYGSSDAVEDSNGAKIPVWGNETLTFIVADEGVVQFQFLNPLDVNEIITEYTNMMDFEDIMDIFKKMILICYANVPAGEQCTMNIERIELGLMRILEPDTLDEGVAVPVWDFYEQNTDNPCLTVNAIDGTIINRALGY